MDDRVPRALDTVRGFGLSEKVIVNSFMPTQLVAARQTAPGIERGLLIHRRDPAPLLAAVMRWTNSAALHPTFEIIDDKLVQQAKAHGWRVNAWTVNEQGAAKRLIDLGVDGLIGDWPDTLQAGRAAAYS